jgi:EmrB/QacA subfamily drug resistance transporter
MPSGHPKHAALALSTIMAAQAMLILDASIVNIALPHIQTSLHFSPTSLSWVFNAYTLAYGGLLLLGGRAGDILGRRRVFVAGIVLFTAASLAGGFATNAAMLLTARAVQGIGGAVAAPSVLALIMTSFAEGAERNRAIGVYSAVSGSGAALGLIIGGALTEWADWRWVFFVNVPVGIVVALATPKLLPETERQPGRFDLSGALTSTVGVTAIVYGFVRASTEGWGDGLTAVSFVAGAVLLAAFVTIEARVPQPILPLRLFRDRDRSSSYVTMLLVPGAMFGVFFFLTQFFQEVRGYSPLAAGAAFLPLTALLLVGAALATQLLPRVGARTLAIAGPVLIGLGVVWLRTLSEGTGYVPAILGPMCLFGLGVGLVFVVLNAVALGGVADADSGAASGVFQTLQQVGGSLGLAILVTVFGTASRDAAKHPVAGADPAKHALTEGIAHAFTIGLVFAVCAALAAVVMRRSRPGPVRDVPLPEAAPDPVHQR